MSGSSGPSGFSSAHQPHHEQGHYITLPTCPAAPGSEDVCSDNSNNNESVSVKSRLFMIS